MDTLELLRRQIDEIEVPLLPTDAEKAQIMKGRKTQADIDAGRKAIQDRVDAYNEATKRRSTLILQLGDLEKDAKKQAQEDYAASPEAMRNKALMVLGPSAFGYGTGYGLGALKKRGQATAETQKNVDRAAVAETGPRAARVEAAEKSGLIPGKNAALRALGRFAPYGAGAAFFGGDALGMHFMRENAETQGEKDIYGAARNLFGGTAAGLGHAGLEAAFAPKVSPDSAALSKILAPDAAPTPIAPPETPPAAPAAPSFKSGAEARRFASSKGVQLPSRLTAAEAIERAEQLKAAADVAQTGSRAARIASKAGKLGVPLAAGALAYDAASSDAEAAGMSPAEATTRGAVAGGTTAGATAGAGYGLTQLLRKVPMLGRAISGGGAMMAPMMAADAYDPTPEQLAMDRNSLARTLPSWLRAGAIEDAFQMSEVPPRNPLRVPMGAGRY